MRRAQGRDPPRVELRFKVSLQCRKPDGRFHIFEHGIRGEHFGHLLEIIRVIRPQINRAARRERGAGERRKAGADEPVSAVLLLRPRVGEINVQGRGGARRQEVSQKIGGFDADAAQIHQPGAAAFAVQFLDAAEQAFDSDEIPVRVSAGVFDKERGVAAAEFHLQRPRLWKQFRQIQRLND